VFAIEVLREALADERVIRMFSNEGSEDISVTFIDNPKGHTTRVAEIPQACFAPGQREHVLAVATSFDKQKASKDICMAALAEVDKNAFAMGFSNARARRILVQHVIDQHGGMCNCTLASVDEIISHAKALEQERIEARY